MSCDTLWLSSQHPARSKRPLRAPSGARAPGKTAEGLDAWMRAASSWLHSPERVKGSAWPEYFSSTLRTDSGKASNWSAISLLQLSACWPATGGVRVVLVLSRPAIALIMIMSKHHETMYAYRPDSRCGTAYQRM